MRGDEDEDKEELLREEISNTQESQGVSILSNNEGQTSEENISTVTSEDDLDSEEINENDECCDSIKYNVLNFALANARSLSVKINSLIDM